MKFMGHKRMKQKPGKFIRIISNIAASFMPTPTLRKRVRHTIRRTQARAYAHVKHQWAMRGDKIIPARYDEYDLIFAIGTTCRISDAMNAFGLRPFSNPFEWTAGIDPYDFSLSPDVWRDSRFNEKIDALCNDFQDYFNYDDFKILRSHLAGPVYQEVANMKTNIKFRHLFPFDQSWQEYFPTAREIIMRRANRLIEKIEKSDRVLILWAHRLGNQRNLLDTPVLDADVKRALKMLTKKWPGKHFDLAFFEHDGTKARFEFDKINVCDGAYRIISNHFHIADTYRVKHPFHTNDIIPHIVLAEMLENIRIKPSA